MTAPKIASLIMAACMPLLLSTGCDPLVDLERLLNRHGNTYSGNACEHVWSDWVWTRNTIPSFFEENCEETRTCTRCGTKETQPFRLMVRITAGTFTMGSPSEESTWSQERPQREVTLTQDFYMSRFEVTQAQWDKIMADHDINNFFSGNDHPVDAVNWYGAIVFSNRLSYMRGLTPVYKIECADNDELTYDPTRWGDIPTTHNDARWDAVQIAENANGYRLPTEAQWEFAARARTTTPWHTGETMTQEQANIDSSSTMEVGSFPPNAWGLFDMHGNVLEWVWDWFANSYDVYDIDDPLGPFLGSQRLLRGGAWDSGGFWSRSAARHDRRPEWETSNGNAGFRVIRPASP